MNKARIFFKDKGLEDRILMMNDSTATALAAAQAIDVELSAIAKSLTFRTNEEPVLVVMSGDAKIDSKKFRNTFKVSSRMLDADEVVALTGYQIGGVCPFAIDENKITVYLDESLKRNSVVYPGCGDSISLVRLELDELIEFSQPRGWVDIGKGWQEDER